MAIKFIFFFILLLSISLTNLKSRSLNISEKLHSLCLNQVKKNKKHQKELSALICGKKFTLKKTKDLFISTGIIHIFVVSGAHLSFYKKILSFIIPRGLIKITSISFLLLYTLTCLFSAPIFRAFTEQGSKDLNKYLKLNLT